MIHIYLSQYHCRRQSDRSLCFHLTGYVFPIVGSPRALHAVAAAFLFVLTRDIATCVNAAKFSRFPMEIMLALADIISRAAILYYDYVLTFRREIELFWKRQRGSFPFVLFIAIRYVMVIGNIPMILYSFWDFSYEVRACLIEWHVICR